MMRLLGIRQVSNINLCESRRIIVSTGGRLDWLPDIDDFGKSLLVPDTRMPYKRFQGPKIASKGISKGQNSANVLISREISRSDPEAPKRFSILNGLALRQ